MKSGGDLVHLLLVPNFSTLPFSGVIEAMRLANMTSRKQLYQWVLISRDGQPVQASNGIRIHVDAALHQIQQIDNLVVCSGLDGHHYQDKPTLAWIRKWARSGAHVGAVCTGAHILARAGILRGYRCTIHWANLDSFSESFPDLELYSELFQIDRDRFTCAGGIASIDMMLHEIILRHGSEVGAQICDQLMHERIRQGHDNQRIPLKARFRISHPKLLGAVQEMERNSEFSLTRDEIANRVGLSRRQMERLFRQYLGTSPAHYYRMVRLQRARLLLEQTAMTITEIAFASGFNSVSHFSKCYRSLYQQTPRSERRSQQDGTHLDGAHLDGAHLDGTHQDGSHHFDPAAKSPDHRGKASSDLVIFPGAAPDAKQIAPSPQS
ncbi:MAG: GlxA family transcriptional regulator, partial [Pseudomonadota bacterium]